MNFANTAKNKQPAVIHFFCKSRNLHIRMKSQKILLFKKTLQLILRKIQIMTFITND